MSRSHRTTIAVASLLALLGLQGHAQQTQAKPAPQTPQPQGQGQPQQAAPDQPQPPPIFRTGINFVRVDVIISDGKGNPIADLQPADFDVTEDGKPQKIETFKLV